jgi:uridine kinase
MDDFFLRPEQRTEERLRTPGENVDHERFSEEVLFPLRRGETPCYRPFSCKTLSLGDPIRLSPSPIYLIEGSYSCHPMLRPYYDLTIFLTTDKDEQMRRIRKRNGDAGAVAFRERWIPLEEAYFSACRVPEQCDLRLDT